MTCCRRLRLVFFVAPLWLAACSDDGAGTDDECRSDQFSCPSQCISLGSVCDGTADCSDGSDEASCDSCGDGVVDTAVGEICDDGVNDALGGGCLPGCRTEDLTSELYQDDLLDIDIQMPAADWEALRHERKTVHGMFGSADCRNQVIVSPYNWYAGDVTINGVTVTDTGLRKKGHIGSQSTRKPSIKLKFSEFVQGQRYNTIKRFALNNSRADATYLRTCLAYQVYRAAGAPAPECTFARVTINGQDLGVYIATEEMKPRFLKRNFPDPMGNLYEGTACDFRSEFFGGFEQKTNEMSDPSRADLQAVYDVVVNASDAELESQLAQVVNLDVFYRFWALESLVWHLDGYAGHSTNYYLYADPADGGRFHFLVWAPDTAFRPAGPQPRSVLAAGAIANRLYAYGPARDRYYVELQSLLDSVWDESALTAEVDRLAAVLTPQLLAHETSGYQSAIGQLRNVINGRRDAIANATAGGYPNWTNGMRTLPCSVPVSTATVSFATTFGTVQDARFSGGTATVDLDLGAGPIAITTTGARAGYYNGNPLTGESLVDIETAGGQQLLIEVKFPNPNHFDGYLQVGSHELTNPPSKASIFDLGTPGAPAHQLGEGTWTFTQVGTTPGSAFEANFTATVYEPYPGTLGF